MTCPCPKCTEPIEHELSYQSKDETPATCPSCKAKVIVLRESFARRAQRNASQIRCTACGSQLGHSINCPSCRALYPDYIVADTRDAVRKRKQGGTRKGLFTGFELSLGSSPKVGNTGYMPQRAVGTEFTDASKATRARRNIAVVVVLVIVLAALAGGVIAFNSYQEAKRYSGTYMKALFCIKSGTELSTQVSLKIAENWKKKQDAGERFQPRPSAEDEASLDKVKGNADKFLLLMQQPPAKFAAAHERLMKLNGIYGKANALALAPSGSPQAFSDSAIKLQNDFSQAAHELASTLPPLLAKELKTAQEKYVGMRDL